MNCIHRLGIFVLSLTTAVIGMEGSIAAKKPAIVVSETADDNTAPSISPASGRKVNMVNGPGSVHQSSNGFSWQKGKKLTWDDFKGSQPADGDDYTAAITYCTIGVDTAVLPRIVVYNKFNVNESWVRPDAQYPEVLTHEQGHFDICELFTRIMNEKMNTAHLPGQNIKKGLQVIYENINKDYQAFQEAYEIETQHGTNIAQQKIWGMKINESLKRTERHI